MYLDYFKFTDLPFGLTPNVGYFCQLPGHQEALNVLLFCLRSGEGFIKIIGEVGSGKTLLCRKLLNSLGDEFFTAYIPNPDLQPLELRTALARELNIDLSVLKDQHELHTLINNRLIELNQAGKRIVLIIDEAQALSVDSLEALRLLTNLETETSKLLQVVMFAQPELDEHLKQTNLRQLKQRITFSYYLPLLSREDLDAYLFHRLSVAGNTLGAIFSKKSRDLLYRASRGVPRIINILSHKALLICYGRGESHVSHRIMRTAIQDTELESQSDKRFYRMIGVLGLVLTAILIIYYYTGII